MADNAMQCKVIIAKHTNKQDLIFKNHLHVEVVSDDFLGDLCIIMLPDNGNKVVNWRMAK